MAISFLAFICMTVTGAAVVSMLGRRFNAQLNLAVALGAGFFAAAATIGLWLVVTPLPLSLASHLAVGVAVTITLLVLARADPLALKEDIRHAIAHFGHSNISFLLVVVIAGYLLLILVNILYRDVFPWDAFTTWMYRAKAWVVSNHPVTFISKAQWFDGGGSDFVLDAAHYPITASALAAFSSILTGGWDDGAANLAWFFTILASLLALAGLCQRQHPENSQIPFIAVALMVTTPLVHLHGALAGYADIWLMGTSGMGLAGLCIWTQKGEKELLGISIGLLALGCLYKTEGWLWLTLGLTVVMLHPLLMRYGWNFWIGLPIALGLLWQLQPLHLGALGMWGISQNAIELGPFGPIALRPHNPLDSYLEMTLWRANFLLLAPLYIGALLLMLRKGARLYSGYLLMGLGIAVIHCVIFGLSAYSKYAEIGTAINRVLLQTLPVFILTVTAVWHFTSEHITRGEGGSHAERGASIRRGAILAGTALLIALPLLITLHYVAGSPSEENPLAIRHEASTLNPVVGDLLETESGYQFDGDDIPIGVARAPLIAPNALQPRYLVAQTRMETPETIAFYWINTESPRVHSVPLPVSGASIVDMAEHPDFWQKPIREMGYLVRPDHFTSTALVSLTLSHSLLDGLPALLNHWQTPEPLSHRLINTITAHVKTPINYQQWLSAALLILCLWPGTRYLAKAGQSSDKVTAFPTAVGLLWALGSVTYFNQAQALTTPLIRTTQGTMDSLIDGSHLAPLATQISATHGASDRAVISVGIDEQGRFDAQRLPFMLLPLQVISVNRVQLKRMSPERWGTVVILGQESPRRRQAINRVINSSDLTIISEEENTILLSMRPNEGGKQ